MWAQPALRDAESRHNAVAWQLGQSPTTDY
jgi:hypothetical protein